MASPQFKVHGTDEQGRMTIGYRRAPRSVIRAASAAKVDDPKSQGRRRQRKAVARITRLAKKYGTVTK